MVSLIAALFLGLLVATAKNKFDTTNQETEEFAAKLMLINRELVNFGPKANDARALLRKYVIAKIAADWPAEAEQKPEPDAHPPWKLLENDSTLNVARLYGLKSMRTLCTMTPNQIAEAQRQKYRGGNPAAQRS